MKRMALCIVLLTATAFAQKIKTDAKVVSVVSASTPKVLTKPGYQLKLELPDGRTLTIRCLPSDVIWDKGCKAPVEGDSVALVIHESQNVAEITWSIKGQADSKPKKAHEFYKILRVN